MDREIIRSYLWQDIIRLAFRPASRKDKHIWLNEYVSSLHKFWETSVPSKSPSIKNNCFHGCIDCPIDMNMYIEYHILRDTNSFKCNIRLISLSSRGDKYLFSHDIDCDYYSFPIQWYLTNHNMRSTAIRDFDEDDIKAVVDGLLLHPVAHQHLESSLYNHEIRLGGGISNPYLFLFHLRYQLCPDQSKREAEKIRLINLFANAVRSNNFISASSLMAQPY